MEIIRISDTEDVTSLLDAIEQNIRTSSIMRNEIEKHHSSTNVIEGIEDNYYNRKSKSRTRYL